MDADLVERTQVDRLIGFFRASRRLFGLQGLQGFHGLLKWSHGVAGALCLLALGAALAQSVEFVALGDLPYGPSAQAYAPYRALIARINQLKPAFSIHVGDFKSGGTKCSDEEFAAQLAHFERFESALFYTPGDNEWTDCHRPSNGAYDPLERLAMLRQMFYVPGQSLGKAPLRVINQSASPGFTPYVENQRWLHQGVLFATLHVVGSNNNLAPKIPSAVAEFQARDEATIAWIREAFVQARQTSARALVLAMHADVFQGNFLREDFYEGSGFKRSIGETLLPLAAAANFPVLLVHGDSHRFILDQPFRLHGKTIPQLTRLQVPGDGDVRAVHITVDTRRPAPFSARLISAD